MLLIDSEPSGARVLLNSGREQELADLAYEQTIGVDGRAVRLARDRVAVVEQKITCLQAEHNELLDAVRMLMDETDPDGEGEVSRNLRRFVMDDADREVIIETKGFER